MYNYQKYEDLWLDPLSDYTRLLKPWLDVYFKDLNNLSILEIGFGSGHLALILASQNFSGSYFGIDIDENADKFAKISLEKYPSRDNFSFDSVQPDNPNLKSKTFDLAIFCLSACEMSNIQFSNYLSNINAKKLLVVNPSTLTQYFQSRITKSLVSKFTSRFGKTPQWYLKGHIPTNNVDHDKRKLAGNQDLDIQMMYRSLGDLLNLCKQNGWNFQKYTDLKYNVSDIKTAPVSKFEVMEFEKI